MPTKLLDYLILKRNAFRVIFLEPFFRGFFVGKDLRWSTSPTSALVLT